MAEDHRADAERPKGGEPGIAAHAAAGEVVAENGLGPAAGYSARVFSSIVSNPAILRMNVR